MNELGGALVPFIKDSKNYPLTLLYSCDDFLIVSGEDRDYSGYMSIGIRWRKSRNENDNKSNPLGFPLTRGTIKCWFIMPEDLALCLLVCIKDKALGNNDKLDKEAISRAIQELAKHTK